MAIVENNGFWLALEAIRGLSAVPATWRHWTGEQFELIRSAFLQRGPAASRFVPCPRQCGCWHEVFPAEPEAVAPGHPPPATPALRAVCRCESWRCDDLELTAAEVTPWELSWPKLGRAVCRALALAVKPADLGLRRARQIGSWSGDAAPVFLTIQTDRREFRCGVAELAARLGRPFILLSPTSAHLDAASQELIERARAGFFDLATHLRLTEAGSLQPRQAPGELLARFQPEPSPMLEEALARRVFALVRQLDGEETGRRAPSALTVFRLYCIDELGAEAVARRCRCAKATVINRLELIRARTGSDPQTLRRLSAHWSQVEDELRDPRARHIHRRNLIDDAPEAESE